VSFGTSLAASTCPYCGEPVQLVVDEGADEQDYIEDCQVCCRPMRVVARLNGADADGLQVDIELRREDD